MDHHYPIRTLSNSVTDAVHSLTIALSDYFTYVAGQSTTPGCIFKKLNESLSFGNILNNIDVLGVSVNIFIVKEYDGTFYVSGKPIHIGKSPISVPIASFGKECHHELLLSKTAETENIWLNPSYRNNQRIIREWPFKQVTKVALGNSCISHNTSLLPVENQVHAIVSQQLITHTTDNTNSIQMRKKKNKNKKSILLETPTKTISSECPGAPVKTRKPKFLHPKTLQSIRKISFDEVSNSVEIEKIMKKIDEINSSIKIHEFNLTDINRREKDLSDEYNILVKSRDQIGNEKRKLEDYINSLHNEIVTFEKNGFPNIGEKGWLDKMNYHSRSCMEIRNNRDLIDKLDQSLKNEILKMENLSKSIEDIRTDSATCMSKIDILKKELLYLQENLNVLVK